MPEPNPKPEPKPEPVEWSPDQPIPDEDGETEAQRRHMLSRRLKYLEDPDSYKPKKGKKGDSEPKLEPKKPWLIGA